MVNENLIRGVQRKRNCTCNVTLHDDSMVANLLV